MTPLAWKIQSSLMGVGNRDITMHSGDEDLDPDNCLDNLDNVHCYDVEAIVGAVARVLDCGECPHGDYSFSPGKRVWLESRLTADERYAFFVDHIAHDIYYTYFVRDEGEDKPLMITRVRPGRYPLPALDARVMTLPSGTKPYKVNDWPIRMALGLFTIINRPQSTNMECIKPHKGRQKTINQKMGDNAFQLLPWHQIKIRHDSGPGEARGPNSTSSRRPLHHVRSYYKPSIGAVIAEHWRGDPSLGIARGDYKA
jgi:hypothetical protein